MLFNSIIAAALGLALAAFYANKVLSIKVTDEKVEELSASIREGSMAFLKRMYSWISVFVVVLAVLISTLTEWGYPWGSIAFVAGAFLSSLAGFIGMRIATAANGRTTEAARDCGTLKALPVAFRGGAVMGFSVAGLGLLGVALGTESLVDGVLIRGTVTLSADPGEVADTLFLSTTNGRATSTPASGSNNVIRVIGYCLDASNGQIWFNPDGTFVEVTA